MKWKEKMLVRLIALILTLALHIVCKAEEFNCRVDEFDDKISCNGQIGSESGRIGHEKSSLQHSKQFMPIAYAYLSWSIGENRVPNIYIVFQIPPYYSQGDKLSKLNIKYRVNGGNPITFDCTPNVQDSFPSCRLPIRIDLADCKKLPDVTSSIPIQVTELYAKSFFENRTRQGERLKFSYTEIVKSLCAANDRIDAHANSRQSAIIK